MVMPDSPPYGRTSAAMPLDIARENHWRFFRRTSTIPPATEVIAAYTLPDI